MELGIKKAISNGDGNTIIYTALIAAILANCTPTLADCIFFSLQDKWIKEKEDGTLSPEAFWWRDFYSYYLVTASYYGVILLTMIALGKTSYSTKSKILLGLVGGGATVAIIFKNIQNDKKIAEDKAKLSKTPN
jgi:hypothetical protein